jgi:hypothetical protein
MKKGKPVRTDDLLPDYDFASMAGGVRGKYVARLKKGSNIVLLEPDVAAAFPTEAAVNEALRALLKATQVVKRIGARPNKRIQRTAGAVGPR